MSRSNKKEKKQTQQSGNSDIIQEAQKFNQKVLLLGLHSQLRTHLYLLGITVSMISINKEIMLIGHHYHDLMQKVMSCNDVTCVSVEGND